MVGKEKNMLYHEMIDKDACWDREEVEPFVFEVEEEYAKAWIENNVAADGGDFFCC